MIYSERLKNLWKATCIEESRFTIQAVRVDTDKKVAVATDGHVMAVIDVSDLLEPDEASFLIPADALKAARQLYVSERARFGSKVEKQKARPVFIRGTDEAVTVFVGTSRRGQSFDRVTGQFPQWETVCDGVKDYKLGITLSVGLLHRLSESLRGDYKMSDGVNLFIKTENDPIAISTQSNGKTFGLLMAMRSSNMKATQFWKERKSA